MQGTIAGAVNQPAFPMVASQATNRHCRGVYFFLDFSNIAIAAQGLAGDFGDSVLQTHKIRLDCNNLKELVLRGREWKSGYAAAGLCSAHTALVDRFRRLGFRFDVCERGMYSGREQGIDDKIQKELYRLACTKPPGATVVLATGDGNGHAQDDGFIPALDAVRQAGFSVEVMSWRHAFNSELRKWARRHGTAIELDDFYQELTFVEGGRPVKPLGNIFRKLKKQFLHRSLVGPAY